MGANGERMRKWKGNGERRRKFRGNGERMRKWREIHSLHFLIFSLFSPFLSISYIKTRQSKHCEICIYLFDNFFDQSKWMVRLVRAEKMVLSGLVFAKKITRMQTWNLSKILHRRIFRLKILHRQFHIHSTVLVGKKHKKWVKMEKFTPLAKILHCRRQWQHWRIPPLSVSRSTGYDMRGGCNLERRLEVGTRRAALAGRQHKRARWTAAPARSWSTQSSSRLLKRRSVELLPKRWQSFWAHLSCYIQGGFF